ncbi:hypothetical protein F2Q69_00057113 [Brassica cretica]|uniref:Uncharacterized protein n=1 Tax=Brassica cretica TaxID=69181 RepID=A0A8S9N976_BRACR|nr:hypothetical protein F2Q69_00057113 [Brassica cretica]
MLGVLKIKLASGIKFGHDGADAAYFLPMVVSTVIACHPFLFRECVRIDPSCRIMKSQVLGRYRLAGVGSSDRSVVV